MFHILALLLEVFAIIICIHRIYDEKIRIDIETAVICILSLGVTEAVIYFELNHMVTMCIYVLMARYCSSKFKDTFVGALISVLLMLIVISVLQFIFVMLADFIFPQNQELRMLIANLFVAASVMWILPFASLHKLRKIFKKKDTLANIIFCLVVITAFMVMTEGKIEKELNITSFVLAVPMTIVLAMLLNKWDSAQEEKEYIENELSVTKSMQEEYDDLLTTVRLREHGFKNHIAALQSIKMQKKLEEDQEDYYNSLCEANKYNKLLFLGNRVVSGYLYHKFCEIEDSGVTVTYEARGSFADNAISVYYIIEMLGILIDNAVEAQRCMNNKRLRFQFEEMESIYWFKILNPYPYVGYAEMESWFLLGNSKKGEKRGLGLYYLKKLCDDYKVDLLCRNIVWEDENWIEFSVGIKKADKL